MIGPRIQQVKEEYGWTSYRKTGLANAKGQKYYEGHFRCCNDPMNYTEICLRFWARHPVLALRKIAQRLTAGESWKTLHEAEIN